SMDKIDFTPSPAVVLATAHPAKFPEAVEKATGHHPALPGHLGGLLQKREIFSVLPNDLKKVQDFISQKR
ncbi:MAG: threonine synthase, partial [Alphaproteobacteria bacterium]|nr:threonine synthase [Alphaproteobacteria bacterium]